MALFDVVEQLVQGRSLSAEGRVFAEMLRSAAAVADDPDATAAGRLRAQQNVMELLAAWSEVSGGRELPRVGLVSGDAARFLLLALGYPPNSIDTLDLEHGFDFVEALKLKRRRRGAGLPVQPGLQAAVDDALDRNPKSQGWRERQEEYLDLVPESRRFYEDET